MTTHFEATQKLMKASGLFAVDARNTGKKSPVDIPFLPKSILLLASNMLTQDEPNHRRLRKLVDGPFMKRAIDGYDTRIAFIVDDLLDEMEAEAKSAGGVVDFHHKISRYLPIAVICEILGLPNEDREQMLGWMETMLKMTSLISIFSLLPVLKKMNAYLRQQFEEARKHPKEGLISELVQTFDDGDQLSEDELLSMVFLLFVAGHETTTHLLSTGLIALFDHPEEMEKLKVDGELYHNAIEEMMRWSTPVQISKPRYARDDFEFEGHDFKKGEAIMAFFSSANRDPEIYEDPHVFNVTRNNVRHLGFGGGMHICLGLHLARSEARICFQKLFDRYPHIRGVKASDELKWFKRIGFRGVTALPVYLS